MKIYTRIVLDSTTGIVEEVDCYEYDGPVALCGGGKGSSPKAPDYGPMAAASKEAARLGLKLGQEQIAESRRQYDRTMETAEPVVASQLGLMEQAKLQGDDYYEYGKGGRSVETALRDKSLVDTTAADAASRDLITGSDLDIYNARKGDIEDQVGTARADARQGLTSQYNTLLRQGMRYGYSPQAIAQRLAGSATRAGLGEASAANMARRAGIDRSRGLLSQNRNMGIQDTALDWGRKLDVAGLYRGMPGASTGAYGVALGAGNSAVGNTMQPGAALMAGNASGAGMQQTGTGQQLTGLSSILNAQTSAYNAAQNQPSIFGSLLGAGATVGAAFI